MRDTYTMHATQKAAVIAILTALVTLCLKSLGYYLTDSVGVLSDAAETLTNVMTSLIAWSALKIAAIPADDNHPYGHNKVEYFSSGIEGTLIVLAGLVIAYTACQRFFHAQAITNIGWGLALVTVSAGLNWATSRYMLRIARQYDTISLEADAHHIMADVWTSVAVVITVLFIRFAAPAWQILDPIAGLLIGLFTLRTGGQLLYRSVNGLMDVALPEAELKLIETALAGRIEYRDLRTRKAGPERFIDLVMLLPPDTSVKVAHALCTQVEGDIAQQLPRCQVFIRVMPSDAL